MIKKYVEPLQSLFLSIDQFGSNVPLLIQRRATYNSCMGAFISLAIFLFIGYQFLGSMIDLAEKKKPNVLNEIINTPNPEKYRLSPDKFFVAVAVGNLHGIPIQQDENSMVFYPEWQLCQRQNVNYFGLENFQVKCIVKPLVKCKDANLNQELMKQMNITNSLLQYCISKDDLINYNISLQGSIQSSETSFLSIKIRKCDKNDSNQKCAPEEKIREQLFSGTTAIIFPDQVTSHQNPDNPYKPVSKMIMSRVSLNKLKIIELYMRASFTQTSDNVIFKGVDSSQIYKGLQLQSSKEIQEETNGYFIQYYFYLDDQTLVYYRSYEHFLDILSRVGGLFKILFLIAHLVIFPISKLRFKVLLAHNIFDFQNEQEKNKQFLRESYDWNRITSKTLSNLKDDEEKSPKHSKIQNIIQQMTRNYIQKFSKYLQANIRFKTLTFQKLTYLLLRKDRNIQIFDGINKLDEKLDVLYILKKLNEIDKLKSIFLTQEQQKIFDLLPKPNISVKQTISNDNDKKLFNYFNPIDLEMKNSLKAYLSIKKLENDPINLRLLNNLEDNLKTYLDFFNEFQNKEDTQINNNLFFEDQLINTKFISPKQTRRKFQLQHSILDSKRTF